MPAEPIYMNQHLTTLPKTVASGDVTLNIRVIFRRSKDMPKVIDSTEYIVIQFP